MCSPADECDFMLTGQDPTDGTSERTRPENADAHRKRTRMCAYLWFLPLLAAPARIWAILVGSGTRCLRNRKVTSTADLQVIL